MHDNKVTRLQQNGIQSVNLALYVISCAIQLVTGNLIKMISTRWQLIDNYNSAKVIYQIQTSKENDASL